MRTLLTLLFITFLCTCGRGQNELLQSGPMLGYCEQMEVMIWAQTKVPALVKVEYTNDAGVMKTTNEVETKRATAHTAKLIADQVQPGEHYTYRLCINGKASR